MEYRALNLAVISQLSSSQHTTKQATTISPQSCVHYRMSLVFFLALLVFAFTGSDNDFVCGENTLGVSSHHCLIAHTVPTLHDKT